MRSPNGRTFTPRQRPPRYFQTYVVDQPEQGFFTIDRSLFTDPDIFELEMAYIFEGSWNLRRPREPAAPAQRLLHHHHGPASRSS